MSRGCIVLILRLFSEPYMKLFYGRVFPNQLAATRSASHLQHICLNPSTISAPSKSFLVIAMFQSLWFTSHVFNRGGRVCGGWVGVKSHRLNVLRFSLFSKDRPPLPVTNFSSGHLYIERLLFFHAGKFRLKACSFYDITRKGRKGGRPMPSAR